MRITEVADKKVLILTADTDKVVYKSASNIPGVTVLEANKPNSYEILHADVVVLQDSAIAVLENSIEKATEEVAA